MVGGLAGWVSKARQAPALRAFRHRDFRYLWLGAFVSFIGTWIRNVAQGWHVYDLTGDVAKLALVAFSSMVPVSVLGLFAGTLTDTRSKRTVLLWCQGLFAIFSLALAALTFYGVVSYWQILTFALLNGVISAFETPARQATVSRVVPPEDLPAAVPLNAMTFNLARVVGPAIGGILLAAFGPGTCYLINGVSYAALIVGVLAIRSDLSAEPREPQPVKDLLFEGMLYTLRDQRLRMLFLMESTTSVFALFYLSFMPAIAKDMLGLSERGLGMAMTCVGIGAISGLVTMSWFSARAVKRQILHGSMLGIGAALLLLSQATSLAVAGPLLAIAGFCGVAQLNTTNTLFQLLSPERLRGRVLAMHIWAISGLAPISLLFFGWFANRFSIGNAITLGGFVVLGGGIMSIIQRHRLEGIE